jgi:uncharacterized membrane protein
MAPDRAANKGNVMTRKKSSSSKSSAKKRAVIPTTAASSVTVRSKPRLGKLGRILPWLLVIGGVIGIICSMVLIYDQIKVWENPGYLPACDLNPIVSCGSVIGSKQGEIFGIPAPFFGLLAFPVFVTVGAAMLAGARFKRWFWQGMQLFVTGGLVFALWLFWLSMYRVHALCPFCLTVDVVTYTLFWYVTMHNFIEGNLPIPAALKSLGRFVKQHHLDILMLWFVIVIAWILHHFWYYFGQHL